MDFIVGFPKSRGYEVLIVVADRLSKYNYFVLFKNPFNAKRVANNFMKYVVCLHGVPWSIVSDHDPLFMSSLW